MEWSNYFSESSYPSYEGVVKDDSRLESKCFALVTFLTMPPQAFNGIKLLIFSQLISYTWIIERRNYVQI